MAFDAGAIVGRMRLNLNEWQSSVRTVVGDSRKIRHQMAQNQEAVAALASSMAAIGGAASAGIALAVRQAMAVEEAENLFQVSFGERAEEVREWSEVTADAMGLSARAMRETAGTLNVMLESMGLAPDAAVEMSQNLTTLTGDLQSFYNLDHQSAFEKIRAGITGEAEPLKQLGVLVNETTTQHFAWANGIAAAGEQLNEQQKVVARYGSILEQTSKAQGDLVRTADSATNQERRLGAEFSQITTAVGNALLPAYTELLQTTNIVLGVTTDWIEENKELSNRLIQVGTGASVAAASIGVIGLVGPKAILVFKGLQVAASAAWIAVTGPIAVVTAGLVAVGAGVYTLRALWKTNFGGMKNDVIDLYNRAVEWLTGLWEPISDEANVFFTFWESFLNDMLQGAKQFANAVIGGWQGIWETGKALFSGEGLDEALRRGAEAVNVDYIGNIKIGLEDTAKYVRGQWKDDLIDGAEIASEELADIFAIVKDQFREDIDVVKQQFPELAASIEKAFQGYTAFDPAALLAGADTPDFDKGSKGAADKARKEFEALVEQGQSLARSLMPVEDIMFQLAEDTRALKAAGRLDDVDSLLGASYWRNLQDVSLDALDQIIERMRAFDAANGTDIASGALGQAAESILGRLQPQSTQMIEDLTRNLEILKRTGQLEGNENLLADFYWDDWAALGTDAMDTVIGKLDQLGAAGSRIGQQFRENLAAEQLRESAERGLQIYNSLAPAQAIVQGLRQDMTDLINAGVLDQEVGNLLSIDFWNRFREEGTNAFNTVIDELIGQYPEFADVFEQMRSQMNSFNQAANFANIANGFGALSQELSRLPGDFEDVARAAQMAQRVMNIAANAATGNWAAVAVEGVGLVIDALGLMGDEAEEELTGIDKLFDELGKKVEEWGEEFTDVLVDFIKTGEANFKEFIDSILEDILRLTIQTTITDPIVGAIQGAIGGFAKGGAFDRGGVVSSPTVFPMKNGDIGLMAEAGPKAIMPLKRMPGGSLGVAAQGGGTVVQIIDQRTNGGTIETETTRGPNGEEIIRQYIRDEVDGLLSKGGLDKSLRRNFGMRRKPR